MAKSQDPRSPADAAIGSRLKDALGSDTIPVAAYKLGVPYRTLKRYVDGKRLDIHTAARVSEVYGVGLDWLITGQPGTGPTPDNKRIGERLRKSLGELITALRAETNVVLDEMTVQLDEALHQPPLVADHLTDDEALAPPNPEIFNLGFRPIARLGEVFGAAGGGANIEDERVTNYLAFRDPWLAKHGLDYKRCSIIDILGKSMEPTLQEGSAILVDHTRTKRLKDRIFAVRTPEGVVVKRLAKSGQDWVLVSDNPEFPPLKWPREAEVIGQVMWTGRTLP